MVARVDIPEDILYQKYIIEHRSKDTIANDLGCSASTVSRNLRRYNIPVRSLSEAMSKNLDRDLLYQKYIIENLDRTSIAKDLECSPTCVYSNLKRYNIPIRTRNTLSIDKDWLYDKYINDGLSAVEISQLLNVTNVTIYYYLKKYNIPTRSRSDAQIKRYEYNFDKCKWDLYYYYIIKEMSTTEIAKIFNCGQHLINFWLHKHNIPLRTQFENFRGSKNPAWKGGITEQKYCYKFNDQFKEYIRDKFNRTCYICGKTEDELNRKLAVHHIDYNKSSICNGKEFAFVPLCHSCHAKTNGNRYYWFNLLINYWIDKYDIYNDLTMY